MGGIASRANRHHRRLRWIDQLRRSIRQDAFVAPAPTIDLRTPATSPLNEFSVDFYPSLLRLSPSGRYVAFTTEDVHEVSTIHAGQAGGSLASFTADDAMFLSESRLLLLERQQRASVLRLVDLAEGHREMWSLNVPVLWADLSIDGSSQRWRLLGRNAHRRRRQRRGNAGYNDHPPYAVEISRCYATTCRFSACQTETSSPLRVGTITRPCVCFR